MQKKRKKQSSFRCAFGIKLAALAVIFLAGICEPARSQSMSVADISAEGEARTTHEITVPSVTSSGLGLYWTLAPPTVEVQGLIETVLPNIVVSKQIPPNLQGKFDVSTAPGGIALAGKNDLQRIDEFADGIFSTASGRWTTQATTFTGINLIGLFITMHSAARVDAVDPPLEFTATECIDVPCVRV